MTLISKRGDSASKINNLRRGARYRAATVHGDTTGEYLGVETMHGIWSMLLRHAGGTDSIPLASLITVESAPA